MDETNEVKMKDWKCGVRMYDRELCGEQCTEIVMVGDIDPPAFLPVCEKHNIALVEGKSLLLTEAEGDRHFALQFSTLNTEAEADTLEKPQDSEPPVLESTLPSEDV